MIEGDPDLEDIYYWGADGQNVDMRGANGKGDGVHILTGPIYVCGAEPGDVLQVRQWDPRQLKYIKSEELELLGIATGPLALPGLLHHTLPPLLYLTC